MQINGGHMVFSPLKTYSLIFLFSLLFLASCGKLESPQINTDYKVYYNKFYALAESKGIKNIVKDVRVEFADLDGEIAGSCYWIYHPRKIVLDKNIWESQGITDAYRESLMFHELGHCALSRFHDDQELSIMNTIAPNNDVYLANYDLLVSELFENTFKDY